MTSSVMVPYAYLPGKTKHSDKTDVNGDTEPLPAPPILIFETGYTLGLYIL